VDLLDRGRTYLLTHRWSRYLVANTWSRGRAALLSRAASRPVTLSPDRRIVSLTFDDVPHSALANATPVLDEYGMRATFYVAPGMTPLTGPVLGDADIRLLADRGHHIGCHTLTHYSLARGTADGLYRDAVAGKEAVDRLLGGHPTEHFSYPYGAVSVRAKALLQGVFATMRTSSPGINVGRADLSYLRAEPLYDLGAGLDLDRVRQRLRSLERGGGWLIFYTHGVRDDPGRYDTSCEDFRRVAELVRQADATVMPVADAVAGYTF
jgi:peptidoglycan/xylan/chitin deacetylase (PgdA/CDA1 family)